MMPAVILIIFDLGNLGTIIIRQVLRTFSNIDALAYMFDVTQLLQIWMARSHSTVAHRAKLA